MRNLLTLLRGLLGRGVVESVDDTPMMRTIQAEFLPGDVREGLEHFEPYGFTSRVKQGAEAIGAFFNGDRSHGVVLVTADRRFRLHVEEGEVAVFDDQGQKVVLKRDGILVETPKNLTATVGGNTVATVSGTTTLKSGAVTIDAPSVHITGTLAVDGHISGTGGLAVSGGSGAAVAGSITATDDIQAGSISLQGHTHTEMGDGAETSTPH